MSKTIVLYVQKEASAEEFAVVIKNQLLTNSDTTIVNIVDEPLKDQNWVHLKRRILVANPHLVIAVGDSGTFLRAILVVDAIPVISASSEKISFFTELTPDNLGEIIETIHKNEFSVENYSRIEMQEGSEREQLAAINDVTIFPERSGLLMHYTLIVDKNVIYRGRADGLIISTPLGSTGYAMSSGGPIVLANPDVFIIVPVNPLNKEQMPLVVPISCDIKIANLRSKTNINAIIDGQLRLKIDDVISIHKAKSTAKVVRFNPKQNILAKLRRRLVEMELRNLEGLAPSAKFIFKLLHTEGEMTQKEIIQSTGLPNRTVRNSLKILKEKGIIEKRPYLRDARQSIYSLS